MNASQLKSLFFKTLIACLVATAAVAVTAILAGGMNDITSRSLFTIVIVGVHALAGLGFINMDGTKDSAGSLKWFANVVFSIIVLSFITAVLGIWDVLPGELFWKLYLTYGVIMVAVLHAEVLARILNHQPSTNAVIYTNYAVMAIVVVMLLVAIYASEYDILGTMFFRSLAALAVIDGTLTLTAIILDTLYLSKHPELITENSVVTPQKRGPSILVILVLGFLGIQLLGMLLGLASRF